MTMPLARTLANTQVEDLRQIAVAMRDHIAAENDSTAQAVVDKINNKPGLLARLFPTAYAKEEQRITLDRMRTMYASRKEFFELYNAVQLEMARKQGDALIASVGMDLRAHLTAFATARIEDVSKSIEESRLRFLERITPHFAEVEKYKAVPEVYEPARQSVQNEIKIYFEGIDELMRGFIEAMRSKVPDART